MGNLLPIVEAKGLILKSKEVCHYHCPAFFHELKMSYVSIVKKYNGKLYITNKRIVFISDSKTIKYQIRNILKYTFTYFTDYGWAFYVYKENQSELKPIYVNRAKEIEEVLKELFNSQ
jgi:hypothetical protein